MYLSSAFPLAPLQLAEAANEPHSNVRQMLRKAVNEAHPQDWAEYEDHTGDGESGDVMYRASGGMKSCPYEISDVNGKKAVKIDTANAKKVVPMVGYQEMADDDDHYTAMAESFKSAKLYTDLPLYERFISKADRDSADAGSFAGKNKSFPILKREDVQAAIHAMGRAGSDNYGMAALKANIIRIAKAKGWEDELPKAWRGTTASEAKRDVPRETETLVLAESDSAFLGEIKLAEAARTTYPVKLISPGTGSRAHYPAEVLKRDGPKVFKAGTLMFWNHPTAKEAAERPEGNLDNLAAILTKDAEYREDGPKGPGLYSEAKVMADYATKVEERAPHIGLSIRAGGTGTGHTVNGKPELKSIDYAESVDYVTKAGRGGMALAEAARDAGILPTKGDDEMTAEEAKKLVESAVSTAIDPWRKRALRSDAKDEAMSILESASLPAQAKVRIVEACLSQAIPEKDGELNREEFRKTVVAEAQREGEYLASLMGSGAVRGMGAGAGLFAVEPTEEELKEARKAEKQRRRNAEALQESEDDVFDRLAGTRGGKKEAA